MCRPIFHGEATQERLRGVEGLGLTEDGEKGLRGTSHTHRKRKGQLFSKRLSKLRFTVS